MINNLFFYILQCHYLSLHWKRNNCFCCGIPEKVDSTLSNTNKEISDLKQCYEKLLPELGVSRQVSWKLREHIVLLELQWWSNCQYSRRKCLELSGLPELENAALKLFKELDIEADSSNIEDSHWLTKKYQKGSHLNFPNEEMECKNSV